MAADDLTPEIARESPAADHQWARRLHELLQYRLTYGHCNVPRGWPPNPSLSHWVINQRRLLRRGRIRPDRRQKLESVGVRWQTLEGRARDRDLRWNRNCNALHAFLRTHGHCDVPEGWKENPDLARWVAHQRRLKRTGLLRKDRLLRFVQLGIDWSLAARQSRIRDRAWERMFYALRQFQRIHGHSNVPKSWPTDPKLARWVARQRFLMKRCALRGERRRRLEELGFLSSTVRTPTRTAGRDESGPPSAREYAWRRHYDALSRFFTCEGHSDVPRRFRKDPTLARWVSHQRRLRGRGRLSAERVALLDRLGFPWSGRDGLARRRSSLWEQSYARLQAYHRKHGTCNVPVRSAEDSKLGRWVATQRALQRQGRLSTARAKLLTRLGLRW